MDTKQLITGSPKEGFYPIVQDTVTIIELNEAVMNLTSESSSEDIAAAFDTVEGFNELIENVRDFENIVNGILVNNDNAIGKIICTIYAYKNQYTCDIEYIYDSKIIRLDITNTDGTLSCTRKETNIDSNLSFDGDGTKFLSDDGTYKTIEVGDKTNVLILSLENDLANGEKDSPVTAEVSAALKDAISTGKACVIKSSNSDILANLQETGNNVTIIMEQISRLGQTFVAVNTTITVNTSTNVISDYQTGALVLETYGDGSKFLSNDGSYKSIEDKIVVIETALNTNETLISLKEALANNKIPFTNYKYNNNPADMLSPIICEFNMDGTLHSYSAFDGEKINTIVVENDERIHESVTFKQVESININQYVGGTLPENYITKLMSTGNKIILIDDDSGSYWNCIPATITSGGGGDIYNIEYIYNGKYNKIVVDGNARTATKTSIDLNIDLSNYLAKNNTTEYTPTENYNPATKKYVDDKEFNNVFRVNNSSNLLSIDNYSTWTESIVIPKNLESGSTLFVVNIGSVNSYGYLEDRIFLTMRILPSTNGVIINNIISNATGNKYIVRIIIKYETSQSDSNYYNVTFTCNEFKPVQRVLTESEYSALGDTSDDDVLYFVIPD